MIAQSLGNEPGLPAPGLAVHDVVTHRVPDDKLAVGTRHGGACG